LKLTLDIRFVLIALGILALFWVMRTAGTVLLPFLIAAFLAVLLEPLTKQFCKWKAPRALAAFASTLLAVVFIFGPIAAIMPILIIEGGNLVERLPVLIESAMATGQQLAARFGLEIPELSTETFFGEDNPLQALGGKIAGSLTGALSGTLLAFLTPVVLFFFLKDWPTVTKTLSSLPPRRYARDVKHIARETNIQLARYVRGQAAVVLVQSIYHAAALFALGLNYSVAIGILTGVSSIIPVVGNLIFFVLALLVATNQYDTIWPVLIVIGIYGIAQLLETVFLAPRLVGDQLKIHPLWIMVGLLVGGSLFGFLGALLALPMVAAGSVIAKHGVETWQESDWYKAKDGKP